MKTIFAKTSVFFAASLLLQISCRNDNGDSSNSLSTLKEVKFQTQADKEISAELTGNTAIINGVAKKEYLITTEKSDMIDVPSLVKESPIEKTILYPGSILRGSSFLEGNYDPLVLSNPFKPVALFLTIKGTSTVATKSVAPTGSNIFQALSDLKIGNTGFFPVEYVPANYSYESTEINNEESFTKSTGVHAKANFAKIISASFDYTNTNTTIQNKKYTMVRLKQTVYSAGIDPKYVTDWIDGSIKASEAGTHEPVYISSVDYGRVAYILVESELSSNEINKVIKASVDFGIGKIGGSVNYEYNEQFKKLFSQNKVKVTVLGGPSSQIITNYDGFMNYLQLVNSQSALVASSAPISYTVRRLKDNTIVTIVNQYKDIKKEYR